MKQFCLIFFSVNLLWSCHPLYADPDQDMQEHVAVGSREIDHETKQLIHERRAREHAQENPDEESNAPGKIIKKALHKFNTSKTPFILAPAREEKRVLVTTHVSSFPVAAHCLNSIADNDLSLELEDGSHWEISYSDSYTLRTWRPGDLITVTPDYSWFSAYDYYITNKSNGTYVKANLHIGPFSFGPFSNWIVDIDVGGHVYLQNGMIWCVHPKDQYLLKYWAINDHIIMGLEDSIQFYYDHILINVNTDEYVRVKQY